MPETTTSAASATRAIPASPSGLSSRDANVETGTDPSRPAERPRTGRLVVAFAPLALFLVLLLPDHPRDLVPASFLRLPLELPIAVLALLALRGAASTLFRALVVTAAGLLLLLRLADLGSRLAFDRAFSPLVELHLIGDGWNLASGTVGRLEAGLAAALALGVFVGLCALLYRGLGGLARLAGPARRTAGALAALALVGGAVALALARATERDWPVQADLANDIVTRVVAMRHSIADQNAFLEELADDPLAADEPPAFEALAGRDVVLVFIESYGRSSLDAEGFRETLRGRLERVEEEIAAAGLHARSAWLDSPIRGGRSWLAHATFASGLSITSQARFDRLLASPRRSLNRLFGAAGWRTAGLMPAIREHWPEGAWYGFDEVLDVDGLGYAGEPFGWVTMPDQYTLTAFERQVRARDGGRPVMAEIALISSHAPWTPLPRLLPWETIGDGAVFDGTHRHGPTSAELWADRGLVREYYVKSLDYSLETLGEYLVRHGRGALFVILGDHQPAAVVNGWGANAHVPIHVVADDPKLLERLPDDWWSDGLVPAADLPARPMATMRETLARRFAASSADGADGTSASADTARP